jgi:vancomycin aglycone glucosyltransferase
MLALAYSLRTRGHTVSFVLPDNFVDWIRAHGFDATGDGIDVEQLMRSSGAAIDSLPFQLRHFTTVLIPRLFDALSRAPEADLIVGAGVQVAAGSVAEARDVPYATAAFCPCVVPSDAAPPPIIRTQTLPRWMNRAIWTIGRPFTERAIARMLQQQRRALGLRHNDAPLFSLIGDRLVVAADRDLGPLPHDVPEQVVGTDAWIFDEDVEIDPRVAEFLAFGAPPVYVGFGSMVAAHAGELASHAIAAIRAIGGRTIVAAGWAELDRHVADADDVLVVPAVPHHAVLPRVAAVVHHGGAGTTTAAARAGRPQVAVPHVLDQFYWAHRVEVLGIGPRALPVTLVTADVLAERVDAAVNDPRIAARASALGRAMRYRNGASAAAELLESFVDCRV